MISIRETILVVDDNDGVRRMAAAVLARAGWTTVEAGSGKEALKAFDDKESPVDVALIDLTMPGMDGATLAAAIRASHPAVRIVLTSGFSEQSVEHHLESNIAEAFLAKPFRNEQLVDKIRSVMDDD